MIFVKNKNNFGETVKFTAFCNSAPAYTVETVEPGLRGALASLQQLLASFGVFFVGLV